MESTDRTRDPQVVLNACPQFLHCLVGKGNDQDLFRLYSLSIHQISDLGCHRSRLARARAGDDQTVVLVGQDHTPLGIVETDQWIHRIQNMVQIVFFIYQRAFYPALIVLMHAGFDRCLRLRALGTQIQDFLHLLHKTGRLNSALPTVKLQHSFFTEYLQVAQVSSPRADDFSVSAGRDIGIFRLQLPEFSAQTDDIAQIRRKLRQAAAGRLSADGFRLVRRLCI